LKYVNLLALWAFSVGKMHLIDMLSRVCGGACRHTPDIAVELGN